MYVKKIIIIKCDNEKRHNFPVKKGCPNREMEALSLLKCEWKRPEELSYSDFVD